MKKQTLCLLLIMAFFLGCREPYDPVMENKVISYLVVEGMINANGVTTIEITRTNRLSEKQVKQFETRATVAIEDDNNTKFALSDQGDGVYRSAANVLPRDRKYRLRIRTSAGKEYLSAFAAVNVTQPVTASWSQDAEGVEITASTKDPSKQTLYYHWTTEETWEINSALTSFYVIGRTPTISARKRTPQDILNAKTCWATLRSANILTASATALADNAISGFSLVKIPNDSDKLAVRYSMLVTQYAISREGYEFFEIMKKNTEKMGSLFDQLPSMVRGNISCTTDPREMVIGFIDCSVSSSSRIFITSQEANNWTSSLNCRKTYVPNTLFDIRSVFANDDMMIADPVIADYSDAFGNEIILGFNAAPADCIDCRLRGNNIRPSFW